VRGIIQRVQGQGKTVFGSSHERGEVESVCGSVAILHKGQVQVEGRVADLVGEHQCDLEQIFLKVVGYQPSIP